jgi:hypothetical protein
MEELVIQACYVDVDTLRQEMAAEKHLNRLFSYYICDLRSALETKKGAGITGALKLWLKLIKV